jgi:hypothetical protein
VPALNIGIESATARLTDAILGNDEHDLVETLREIASEIGISHIAYLRLSPDKSTDIGLLSQSLPIRERGSNDTFCGNM